MLIRIRLFAAVVFCVSVMGCGSQNSEPRTAPVRPEKVGRTARTFVDHERTNWQVDGQRPMTTVVWYPAVETTVEEEWLIGEAGRPVFFAGWAAPGAEFISGEETYPLILLSHGTGGSAIQLAWLAEYLASHGFIVAAVNHHGNTAAEDELMPQGFMLFWERAIDLSKVLDQLLVDEVLGPRIDQSRIGAAGYSLGGYTVLSVGGARTSLDALHSFCVSPEADVSCQAPPEFPEALELFDQLKESDPIIQSSLARHNDIFRDERIRSIYAMAPAVGMALTEESLRSFSLPVKIVLGDADEIVPPETNGLRVAESIDGCEVETLPGVGHYTFLAECTPRGKKYLPICRDREGVNRVEIHQLVAEDVLGFFSRSLAP
ncbi:MAG: peptidase [bacterium]|nr:peptidase [bacterium]